MAMFARGILPAIAMMAAVSMPAGAPAAGRKAAAGSAAWSRYARVQLGGITALLRYAVARPDRSETRYLFLSGEPTKPELPEEVQVLGPTGEQVRLSDQDGADCTLSHVEIVAGSHPAVLSAVRVFAAAPQALDQSRAAPMELQIYRPVAGQDAGDSRILLRAVGAAIRSAPLCALVDVRAAMLRAAATARK